MKKAIIYLRTSSDRQIDNTSFDTQEQICRSYCEREALEVVGVQKHEAESAKGDNIKRIAELLEYCKNNQGKFEVLVVYKLDRFSRDTEKHLWLRSEILKLGIVLRSATENIDETSQGRFLETILAAVAQLDNDVRRERVKIALWRRIEEGLWPWPTPLGYYHPKVPGVRLSVVEWDTNCYQTILDVFHLYSTGVYTMNNLAKEMSKKHIKNWKGRTIKFSKQSLHKTFNNFFYVGLLKNQDGKLVKGQHKPLIEMALWTKCQEVMNNKSHSTINKRLVNNPDFPLRKFTLCGFCHHSLTACWTKGGAGGHYAYYYCLNNNCEKYGKMIPRNTLHNEFLEYLKFVKPKDEKIAFFKEIFIDRYNERLQDIKGSYLRQLEDIKQLGKEQEWLIEKGKKGVISDDLLKKQLDEQEQKITLAKMGLTDTHAEELEIDSLLNYALVFIQTPDLAWFDAIPEAKMKYQRLIFPEGVNYQYNGFSNSKLGLPFQLINDLATKKTTDVSRQGLEP